MPEKTNSILRCLNVHKKFFFKNDNASGIHVLKGIDLEIFEGELVSIVGASGAGKSTLLHLLGGLDRPTGGTVYWRTQDIFVLNDDELPRLRAKEVGFIFQFHHLLPEFTALENVALAGMIAGQSFAVSRTRAKELLTRVGLAERVTHKPSELSGGEQQRVAVARALSNRPRIIFADEPTGNLDSANAQQLYDLIVHLNRSEGQTFIIVTHNEKFAEQSDRVFRMSDGILGQI